MDDRRLGEKTISYSCCPESFLGGMEALVRTEKSLRVRFAKHLSNGINTISFYNSTLERWQPGKHCKKLAGSPCRGRPTIVPNHKAVS